MALNYERIGWENAPSTNTPIDAGSLNHMDNGILAVSNQYDVDVPYLQEQIAGIPAMLDSYLADQIGIDVGKWLDDHVTPGGSTIVVDDTLTISGAAADSKAVGDALAAKPSQSDVEALEEELNAALTTKAEQDGAYPNLTAGQLLSKNEASDSVPYNFRAVGQNSTLEYTDAIVGGSVVANQQAGSQDRTVSGNGITISFDHSTGKTTVTVPDSPTGFAQMAYYGGPIVAGHRYLICIDKPVANGIEVYISGTSGVRGSFPAPKNQTVIETTAASSPSLQFFVGQSTATGTYEYYVQIFDLTLMLGTAIADYVLSLETVTAGSGVAWLHKHFPKMFTYQEYNAGEIVSVQGLSQHVTTGFNQWDEEWEVGNINATTGQNEASSSVIRSKNHITVLPNSVYYANVGTGAVSNFVWYEYDADKNYLGQQKVVDNGHGMFTTSANAHYIRFRLTSGYGTTYNHDICINLGVPTRNGEYEPYVKHTYPLDDSLTLRGIMKLDSNNQLYADGDRYLPDGTVRRRYGVVDLGTLEWSYYSSTSSFFYTSGLSYKATYSGVCDKYVTISNPQPASPDKVFWLHTNGNLRIYDSAYTDAATFKTAMSGVYLVYELATPTTEEADPYTVPQIVDPNGTEEYVSTSIVPVGHESRYPLDIAGRLDKILAMPTADGTYTLRATVNNGAVSYAWVST